MKHLDAQKQGWRKAPATVSFRRQDLHVPGRQKSLDMKPALTQGFGSSVECSNPIMSSQPSFRPAFFRKRAFFKNFNRTPSFLQLLSIREATDTSDSSFESHDALAFLLQALRHHKFGGSQTFLEGMVPDLSGNVGRFAKESVVSSTSVSEEEESLDSVILPSADGGSSKARPLAAPSVPSRRLKIGAPTIQRLGQEVLEASLQTQT